MIDSRTSWTAIVGAAKDPILFYGGDFNLYAYVGNDPINLVDPTGLAVGDWWDPRTYATFWGEAGDGAYELWGGYSDMREANWINGDKYFHCIAHCLSGQQQTNGAGFASDAIGWGRELFDHYGKRDTYDECRRDIVANEQGREGQGSCEQRCSTYRPAWAPEWTSQ